METENEFKINRIIKDVVKGLDNTFRWTILEILLYKGELTYSNLRKELKINNKGKLNFHLNKLSSYGLITRSRDLREGLEGRSYYDISYLGKKILTNLIFSLESNTILIPPSNTQNELNTVINVENKSTAVRPINALINIEGKNNKGKNIQLKEITTTSGKPQTILVNK